MPLNEYGEKLDSNGYAPSILHDKPVCLICGRYGTARHEVYFGSAYRAKSKRLGLWVTLCPWCHQNGPTAIHNNRDVDLRLKRWAQKKAIEHYGWPEARFIQEFGRSYLGVKNARLLPLIRATGRAPTALSTATH